MNGTRIGAGSYDSISGTMMNMFNIASATPPNPNVVLLHATTGLMTSGN